MGRKLIIKANNRSIKPPKKLIEDAKGNGSVDRLNVLVSAAHICMVEANTLMVEAADMLAENGLMLGELGWWTKSLLKEFDRYNANFTQMILTDETKKNLFNDYEAFDKIYRKIMKIDEDVKEEG